MCEPVRREGEASVCVCVGGGGGVNGYRKTCQ